MYDLSSFHLRDMILAGQELRALGGNRASMEAVAQEIVVSLCERFQGGSGEVRALALVRCFKTHSVAQLPPELRVVVEGPGERTPAGAQCLVLLASCGDRPAWNGREQSQGHRVILLATAEMVERAPMIARMIRQMGLEINDVIAPAATQPSRRDGSAFHVFHVEDAVGSEFVPAQSTFVLPEKIRSVLGFGGVFSSGEMFAVVMFSRVHIPPETAELFRTLALSVKLLLLPFSGARIFDGAAVFGDGAATKDQGRVR